MPAGWSRYFRTTAGLAHAACRRKVRAAGGQPPPAPGRSATVPIAAHHGCRRAPDLPAGAQPAARRWHQAPRLASSRSGLGLRLGTRGRSSARPYACGAGARRPRFKCSRATSAPLGPPIWEVSRCRRVPVTGSGAASRQSLSSRPRPPDRRCAASAAPFARPGIAAARRRLVASVFAGREHLAAGSAFTGSALCPCRPDWAPPAQLRRPAGSRVPGPLLRAAAPARA